MGTGYRNIRNTLVVCRKWRTTIANWMVERTYLLLNRRIWCKPSILGIIRDRSLSMILTMRIEWETFMILWTMKLGPQKYNRLVDFVLRTNCWKDHRTRIIKFQPFRCLRRRLP